MFERVIRTTVETPENRSMTGVSTATTFDDFIFTIQHGESAGVSCFVAVLDLEGCAEMVASSELLKDERDNERGIAGSFGKSE